MEENLDKNNEVNKEISDNTTKSNSEEIKGPKSEKVINMDLNNADSATKVVIKNEINKEISDKTTKSNSEEIKEPKSEKVINMDINNGDSATKVVLKNEINTPEKPITKPKKELPVEKKPFQEFINMHLIPSLTEEINQRGLEINNINLTNTNRPIAGDKCWVINCEIKDTCNFWLSFEKDDISSLKSISLSKPNQKPSIIESFLIDEKRITLKLIISRVLQRLNGQKLIGVN